MEASDDKKSVKLGANEVQDPAEIFRNRNAKSEEIETLFMRFPHLACQIFGESDNQTLVNCRELNQFWKMNIDNERVIWIRKIINKIKLSTNAIRKTLLMKQKDAEEFELKYFRNIFGNYK